MCCDTYSQFSRLSPNQFQIKLVFYDFMLVNWIRLQPNLMNPNRDLTFKKKEGVSSFLDNYWGIFSISL